MHLTLLICPVILAQVVISSPDPVNEADLIAKLTQQTQELYNAIVPGNQAPWKKYYADDCVFADEKGRILSKKELVADITALPGGYSGSIKIQNVQSRVIGDTAVLSYEADETQTIYGQEVHARYHTTDTWVRRNNNWQIIASQSHRYYADPAVGEVDPKKFPDFIGIYQLAPGYARVVSSEGDKLFIERKSKRGQSGNKEQLFPETPDIFFRKGVEGRTLFHYDEQGNVDALIDRRNNQDVVWRKKE